MTSRGSSRRSTPSSSGERGREGRRSPLPPGAAPRAQAGKDGRRTALTRRARGSRNQSSGAGESAGKNGASSKAGSQGTGTSGGKKSASAQSAPGGRGRNGSGDGGRKGFGKGGFKKKDFYRPVKVGDDPKPDLRQELRRRAHHPSTRSSERWERSRSTGRSSILTPVRSGMKRRSSCSR